MEPLSFPTATAAPVTATSEPFAWPFLEKAGAGFLISVPLLLLLLVSLPAIATGYWADEIFSITASRSLPGLFRMFRDLENNMSLYQIVLYFWIRAFGESEVATHSLSLLFALATIPVFFRLLRTWFNKSISFCGTSMLAVSPLFVYDALESRSYSMLILSVTVSTLLFVRLLQKPGYARAFLYGLSVAVGVYVHYFAILIPLVNAVMLTRKTLSGKYILCFVLAGAVAVAGILPLVLFPPRNKTQVDWIVTPDLQTLWYVFSALFGGGVVIVLVAACLVFVAAQKGAKRERTMGYAPEKLAVFWALGPVLLLYIFSHLAKPVFVTRFFAWCAPGAALFTLLAVMYGKAGRAVKSGACLLLLVLIGWKAHQFLRYKGSGFKESVTYLKDQVRPGDVVLVYPYFWALHVDYYLDKTGSTAPNARAVPVTTHAYLPGGGGVDPDPDLNIVRRAAGQPGRVYLFCNGNPGLSKSDTNQKRLWLPQIRGILAGRRPTEHETIFGPQTQCPVRVVVYE